MHSTSPDPFIGFLENNQWLGLVMYIVWKEAWPFLRDKVWSQKVAERRQELDIRNGDRKAEMERVSRLEEREVKAEERQATAFEGLQMTTAKLSEVVIINNERLSTLIVAHNEHAKEMSDDISTMREKILTERLKNK